MSIRNKISFYISLSLLIAAAPGYAQFVNNGSTISLVSGATLTVNGDFTNLAGSIQNFGNIRLKGSWTNNATAGAFTLASTGNMFLEGTNQTIGGTQKTIFPNLTLNGSGVKKLLANAAVRSTLTINDLELALDDKNLEVLGSSVNAINYGQGFISTDDGGYLYRHTNTADDYTFPLGSKLTGSLIYRPVTVKTNDNLDNTIGLGFVNKDPNTAGYNRDAKRFDVNEINVKYYYLVDQLTGTSALEYQFGFDKAIDGDFNQLVKWINFGLWEKGGVSNIRPTANATADARIATLSTLKPVKKTPLTLSFITPTNDPITIFNSFSPDGDGKNDKWEIKNIDLFPDNELTILNRWGSEVFKAKNYNNANAWEGKGLNKGTYFYLLKVNINNEAKVYKGFITLLKND